VFDAGEGFCRSLSVPMEDVLDGVHRTYDERKRP